MSSEPLDARNVGDKSERIMIRRPESSSENLIGQVVRLQSGLSLAHLHRPARFQNMALFALVIILCGAVIRSWGLFCDRAGLPIFEGLAGSREGWG